MMRIETGLWTNKDRVENLVMGIVSPVVMGYVIWAMMNEMWPKTHSVAGHGLLLLMAWDCLLLGIIGTVFGFRSALWNR